MTRYGQLYMVVIKLYNDFIRHDESSSKSNYPCYLAAVANNVFSYCRYWKSSQHVVPTTYQAQSYNDGHDTSQSNKV